MSRISAYLVEGELDGSPAALQENAGKSFIGSFLLGMGFTFDDVNAAKGKATPLAEMQRLIAAEPRNAEVIKPYLGGEELNNSPTHAHHRYVINFSDWPLRREPSGESWASMSRVACADQMRKGVVAFDYPHSVAADWPEALAIVERLVKPERMKQNDEGGKRYWWRFLRTRPELYQTITGTPRLFMQSRVSPMLMVGEVTPGTVFAESAVLFAFPEHAAFAALQSRVHEVWARFFASSMKDDLRYTPSDCFETFPLPPGYADDPALEGAGRAYHDHRAALMVARNQGMTPTYNRFHAKSDEAADVGELRRLHDDMDRAVLRAYGWDDLADRAAPVFLDDATEDDHKYQGRLFWPAAFRDELLARLLRLNEERAAAERRL